MTIRWPASARLTTGVIARIDELMRPLTDGLSAGEQQRLGALLAKVLHQ